MIPLNSKHTLDLPFQFICPNFVQSILVRTLTNFTTTFTTTFHASSTISISDTASTAWVKSTNSKSLRRWTLSSCIVSSKWRWTVSAILSGRSQEQALRFCIITINAKIYAWEKWFSVKVLFQTYPLKEYRWQWIEQQQEVPMKKVWRLASWF